MNFPGLRAALGSRPALRLWKAPATPAMTSHIPPAWPATTTIVKCYVCWIKFQDTTPARFHLGPPWLAGRLACCVDVCRFLKISIDANRVLYISRDFYKCLWISMDFYRKKSLNTSLKTIRFNENNENTWKHCKSIRFYENQLESMTINETEWNQ